MNNKSLVKSIVRTLLTVLLLLVSVELALRIAGGLITKNKALSLPRDNAFRIMFIGDSWTEGADAPKEQGYADDLIRQLRATYPSTEIQAFNLGKGSFNSAEASLEFLKNYKKIKPALLVVLTGTNNCWNIEDVELARKYFLSSDNGSVINDDDSLYSKALTASQHLKIVKLFNICYFNFILSHKEVIGHHPMNDYVGPYFQILAKGNPERAREYLIKNLNRASSYDDFYRVMLYSFAYDTKRVEEYLKSRSVWKPSLIHYRFDKSKRSDYLAKKYDFLKEHIKALKQICDSNNIVMILQDYPFMSPYCFELDQKLGDVAQEYNIMFVSQYKIFNSQLSQDAWKRLMTFAHVNSDGYKFMAANLLKYIVDDKIVENYTDSKMKSDMPVKTLKNN